MRTAFKIISYFVTVTVIIAFHYEIDLEEIQIWVLFTFVMVRLKM